MNTHSNLSFLLKVSGREKLKLYLSAFLSIISALFATVPYILMYNIILEFLNPTVNLAHLANLVYWTCGIVIVRLVTFLASGILSHVAAFTILYELRMQAISHMAKLPLGFFIDSTLGEIKKTINEDVEKLENFIAHQIPDLASAIVTPIAILIFLVSLDWRLGLTLLIPVILSFLVQMGMFKNTKERMIKYHELLGNLNTTIVQYINGMSVMKAFNLSAKSFDQYQNATKNYADYWEEITKQSAPFYSAFLVLSDTGLLFMIPFGGYFFLTGSLDAATYVLFLILSASFLSSLKALLEFGSHFSMLLEGAGKVRNILEMPIQDHGTQRLSQPTQGRIQFENVNFAYEQVNVLQNFSLDIKPQTIVALVGPSGSGKTTVGQLLGRFWDIHSGRIRLDGVELKDLQMDHLMDQVSFVFQSPFMLHDSLLENIRLGMAKTDQEVIEAAKSAQIHDLICSLPNGYQTKLGEDGIKLSGGEKQRISIARAILKDSPIVVLDEVTSYSDIENESKIQEALRRLLKGKTAIIIAHRLYTIQNADQIVVLDEGLIKEQGTHRELMALKGLYHHLWRMGGAQVNEEGIGAQLC